MRLWGILFVLYCCSFVQAQNPTYIPATDGGYRTGITAAPLLVTGGTWTNRSGRWYLLSLDVSSSTTTGGAPVTIFSSGSATTNFVLTANGSGGMFWQIQSGSSSGGLTTNDVFGFGNTNWVRWLNFTNDVNGLIATGLLNLTNGNFIVNGSLTANSFTLAGSNVTSWTQVGGSGSSSTYTTPVSVAISSGNGNAGGSSSVITNLGTLSVGALWAGSGVFSNGVTMGGDVTVSNGTVSLATVDMLAGYASLGVNNVFTGSLNTFRGVMALGYDNGLGTAPGNLGLFDNSLGSYAEVTSDLGNLIYRGTRTVYDSSNFNTNNLADKGRVTATSNTLAAATAIASNLAAVANNTANSNLTVGVTNNATANTGNLAAHAPSNSLATIGYVTATNDSRLFSDSTQRSLKIRHGGTNNVDAGIDFYSPGRVGTTNNLDVIPTGMYRHLSSLVLYRNLYLTLAGVGSQYDHSEPSDYIELGQEGISFGGFAVGASTEIFRQLQVHHDGLFATGTPYLPTGAWWLQAYSPYYSDDYTGSALWTGGTSPFLVFSSIGKTNANSAFASYTLNGNDGLGAVDLVAHKRQGGGASLNGQAIGGRRYAVWDGTASRDVARLLVRTTATASATNNPAAFEFYIVPTWSTGLVLAATIDGAGLHLTNGTDLFFSDGTSQSTAATGGGGSGLINVLTNMDGSLGVFGVSNLIVQASGGLSVTITQAGNAAVLMVSNTVAAANRTHVQTNWTTGVTYTNNGSCAKISAGIVQDVTVSGKSVLLLVQPVGSSTIYSNSPVTTSALAAGFGQVTPLSGEVGTNDTFIFVDDGAAASTLTNGLYEVGGCGGVGPVGPIGSTGESGPAGSFTAPYIVSAIVTAVTGAATGATNTPALFANLDPDGCWDNTTATYTSLSNLWYEATGVLQFKNITGAAQRNELLVKTNGLVWKSITDAGSIQANTLNSIPVFFSGRLASNDTLSFAYTPSGSTYTNIDGAILIKPVAQ